MPNLNLFLTIFIITAVLARFSVFFWPGSFDITGFLRKKTQWHIHHIHIGLLLIFVVLPLAFIKGFANPIMIFLAIGLSLSLDESAAWITKSEYPRKKEFIETVILYFLFVLYVLILKMLK